MKIKNEIKRQFKIGCNNEKKKIQCICIKKQKEPKKNPTVVKTSIMKQ